MTTKWQEIVNKSRKWEELSPQEVEVIQKQIRTWADERELLQWEYKKELELEKDKANTEKVAEDRCKTSKTLQEKSLLLLLLLLVFMMKELLRF